MEYSKVPKDPRPEHRNKYFNETERNIHIWCSATKELEKGGITFGLIGGLYRHKNNPISANNIYDWINLIIKTPSGSGKVMLLWSKHHPRDLKTTKMGAFTFPTGWGKLVPPSKRNKDIPIGHYYIFLSEKENPHIEDLFTCWPNLKVVPVRGPTQKRTDDKKRSSATREATRRRDNGCVGSGTEAKHRGPLGRNFVGQEAAHILALFTIDEESWKHDMHPDAKVLVATFTMADQPYNVMMLRTDLHRLFDAYQWSVWCERRGEEYTYRIFRFGRSAARSMAGYKTLKFPSQYLGHKPDPASDLEDLEDEPGNSETTVDSNETPPGSDSDSDSGSGSGSDADSDPQETPGPSPLLLNEHFRACLLMQVRGFGERRRGQVIM